MAPLVLVVEENYFLFYALSQRYSNKAADFPLFAQGASRKTPGNIFTGT